MRRQVSPRDAGEYVPLLGKQRLDPIDYRAHAGGAAKIRCRRDTETMGDLGDADVGIGQQRFGSLHVIVGEFRRPTSGAAKPTGFGSAG